ncbi:MAG: glycosyltransferase family 4 protein [Candidatus Omnitrophica bacterium]|nr:glycosyltransferase family 4 protein [Candidatus Omnitrophota bacterium]
MRIVYFATWNETGGGNRHLANLMLRLQNDFDCMVVICSTVEDEIRDLFLKAGLRPQQIIFVPHWQKIFFVPFLFTLRKVFKKMKPDIIHSFGIQADIFSALSVIGLNRIRLIGYYESQPLTSNTGKLKNLFYSFINRIVGEKFCRTIAVSEGIKQELILQKVRKSETIDVVYLGIDNSWNNNANIAVDKNRSFPIIGTVGRLSAEKRLDRIIRIMPKIVSIYPKAQLIFVGKGIEQNYLENLSQEHGIENNVKFTGWVADVGAVIRTFDFFVMSSAREGCPNALLEAMSFAKPVIVSDIPGINEIISNGRDGLLIDTENVEIFAEAILKLCQDLSFAVSLGQAAHKKVLEKFSAAKEIESLKNIYNRYAGNDLK